MLPASDRDGEHRRFLMNHRPQIDMSPSLHVSARDEAEVRRFTGDDVHSRIIEPFLFGHVTSFLFYVWRIDFTVDGNRRDGPIFFF